METIQLDRFIGSLLDGKVPAITITEKEFTTQVFFKDGVLTVEGGHDETATLFFKSVFEQRVVHEYQAVKAKRDALAAQVNSLLDNCKASVKKEFELLKEIERLEIELKKRDEQNAGQIRQGSAK